MRIFTILLNFKTKLLLLIFLIGFCLQITSAKGATKSWTGAVSTDWAIAGNWTGGVPLPGDDVVIGDNTSYFKWPTIKTSEDITIKSFTFKTTYSAPTPAGIELTVNGILRVTTILQEHNDVGITDNYFKGTGSIFTTDIIVGNTVSPKNASRTYKTTLYSSGVSITAVNLTLRPNSFGSNKFTDAVFELSSGILNLSGFYRTVNDNLSFSTLTVYSGAKLVFTGANGLNLTSNANGSINFINFLPGSTVEYAGSILQTVYTDLTSYTSPAIAYSNIIFSGAGQKNVVAGNLRVTGNWTSSGGKLDLSTNNPTVNFNGSTAQSLSDAGSDAANGVYFKNVTFSNGGTKSIDLGKFSVATNGILTMAALNTILEAKGNLYLKSDASGSANVEVIPAGCLINGNVNVESWLTGGNLNRRSTRMMSSPVSDISTASPNKVLQQLKKYLVITGPGGAANGFDPGNAVQPSAVTLTRYVEPNTLTQSQFASVPTLNATVPVLGKGEGFFLFYRGDRTGYDATTNLTSRKLNQTPTFAVPESFAMNYTGVLNQQGVDVTLSRTANGDIYDGFNVIGNPYPATINFNTLSTNNSSIQNFYVLVKPDKSGIMSYSALTGKVNNGGTVATDATARYIQPGQAFYVVKAVVEPSTTYSNFFTESVKATANAPARLLSVPLEKSLQLKTSMSVAPLASDTSSPWPALRINLQDAVNTDEAAIFFKEGFQKEYEGSDVPYFSGTTVSLSTLSSDDKSLAINIMPDLKEVSEVKLNFYASTNGPLKLNFTDISAAMGYQVFLKDCLFPALLKEVTTGFVYDFTIDLANATSFGLNRFSLIFKPEPMEAPFSFTAEKSKNGVELNWIVKDAKNAGYFEVENSNDGIAFTKMGEIKNNANLTQNVSFSFFDKTPFKGTNYYRVKQIARNGNFIYTNIKSIDFSIPVGIPGDHKLIIYPNPASDQIQVKFSALPSGPIEAVIFDLQRKRLYKKIFTSDESVNINISQLIRGIYIIELKEADTKKPIATSKFTVGL